MWREEVGRFLFEIKIYSLQFLSIGARTVTQTHMQEASTVEEKQREQNSSLDPVEKKKL